MKLPILTHFLRSATIIVAAILFSVIDVKGQFPQRALWDGPFDIKMIGSAQQIPVYYRASNASSNEIYIDSIVRQETILRSGNRIHINNQITGFNNFTLPRTSFMCNGDPNVGVCTSGLPTNTATAACPIRYSSPTNQSVPIILTYADYDTDNTTFSSSMAELSIPSCSEIEAAYLYWTGAFQGSGTLKLVDSPFNSYTGNADAPFQVTAAGGTFDDLKMKVPGSATYTALTADQVLASAGDRYVCVKNVTTLVRSGAGSGQYWVADIRSWPIGNKASGGWGLVVVYRNPLSPPRRISLFDGYQAVGTTPVSVTLTGLQVPATSNFKSYVGFGALDAEDVVAEFDNFDDVPPNMEFTTGSTTTAFNQFVNRKYKVYKNNGMPALCNGDDNKDACGIPLDAGTCMNYDGVVSSRISTYDEVADDNGAEIPRLPSHTNTYGLDLHHMKIPDGAVVAGATQATITLTSAYSGGYNLFMTYLAIERLQPKLVMEKIANSNTTTPGSTMTYTLRIKNIGNTASLGSTIYDTLDLATDYAGSLTSIRYVNGVPSGSAGVTLAASSSGRLQFKHTAGINRNDSIDITFTVSVKPYAGNSNLWDVQCKRTIINNGYVRYKASSAAGNTDSLTAKSNSNDCGIGTETRVLVTGFTTPTTNLGPYDVCSNLNQSSFTYIRTVLDAQSGITTPMLDDFDIRDAAGNRVNTTDLFTSLSSSASDMNYYAYRDLVSGGTCQQVFRLTFESCLLPVELISFDGWKEDNIHVLAWSTAWEVNNDHFIIERSSDGVHFAAIGTLQGKGKSSTVNSYRFEDEKPLNGANYYRLKQVDHDGSSTHSNIVSINNEKADINIYPNPNDGTFTISLLAPDKTYTLEIIDVDGRLVYTKGGEVVPSEVEIANLAKGIYIVRFYIDQETVIKKMVVY